MNADRKRLGLRGAGRSVLRARALMAPAVLAMGVSIGLCVTTLGCIGGSKAATPGGDAKGADSSKAVEATVATAMVGKQAVCAATGTLFTIGDESRSAIYHGRTLYFRDGEALTAFIAKPEGYSYGEPLRP